MVAALPTPLRVRFCPAPSGVLHVGSARTALFNWLVARGRGGAFVLRIEDTDVTRATTESMRGILDGLAWLGLDWDEGPETGGSHGPYVQSERSHFHTVVARLLVDAGVAYEDWANAEELEVWRESERSGGGAPVLKGPLRAEPRPGETGSPSLRVRTPEAGKVEVEDRIRGTITFDWADIGDFIVLRANGSPTYLLANAADDVAQGISFICRGEDLLSVTPRQVLLHEALTADGLVDAALEEAGLPARDPAWGPPSGFAHQPLIVGEDRQKLSKRHGSVAIQEFAEQGYLPEVLVNYLALLGWGPGDGRERLRVDELVDKFDIDAVGRTPAAFDMGKLAAFNGERIRELGASELADHLVPFLDGTHGEPLVSRPPTEDQRRVLEGLVPLVQERMQRLDEVRSYAPAFFREEIELDATSVEKVLAKADAAEVLEAAAKGLEELDEWSTAAIETRLRLLCDELEKGAKKVFQPIRVAVTGSAVSPPLFESLELIGRERSLERIVAAVPVAREAAGAPRG